MLRPIQALHALAALLMLGGLAASPATAASCDRACLHGLITQYADALLAHDPSNLPVTANVRFTEDSKDMKLGDGLWKTVTSEGTFRQDYLDTHAQIAASHIEFFEGKVPALLSLVLHVKDGKIAGVESLIQRVQPTSRWQPTELGKPIRHMNDPIPTGKKGARAQMIKTALGYTEGLRIGDFTQGGTKFAPEAYRVENGVITAGEGCGRKDCGMYVQHIIKHPDVKASVAAVDEDNGIVLLWMNFGNTGSYGDGNALVTFEAFKVWGGAIHAVNAFFHPLPEATQRGWPSAD